MWKIIFTTLDNRKNPPEADIKKIQPFLFLRWLQKHPGTIMAANQFNLYQAVPIVNQYNAIKLSFAHKKIYIPYQSDVKDTSHEDEIIARHFKINPNKVPEYRELMDAEDINNIVKLYTEK